MVALTVLTLWILIQGYLLATGQSREAAMGLVVTALRASLIIGLATSMAEGSSKLYWTLTDGVSQSITQVVTGDSESPYDAIDKNLGLMQIAMMSIDQIQTAGNQQRDDEKTRARWFTGVGMAGPGVVGGLTAAVEQDRYGAVCGLRSLVHHVPAVPGDEVVVQQVAAIRVRYGVFVVGAELHGEPGNEGDRRSGCRIPCQVRIPREQWRGHQQHGIATRRARFGHDNLDRHRTADGRCLLPGHAGPVHGVLGAGAAGSSQSGAGCW